MTRERFEKLKGVLNRRQPDLTVLMENVHKHHNLSAVIRTCDAVGVFEAHAVSPDGEVRRHHLMSGGSRKWVPVRRHAGTASAIETLQARGMQVLAAHFSDRSVDFRAIDYTRPTAVLLGAELDGVTEEAATMADEHIVVPMQGLVASLNVSVAAAVILFEAQRQREAAGLYDRCRLDEATWRTTLFEWAQPQIAAWCRRRGVPYPALDEDGDLAHRPGEPPAGEA